MPQHEGKLFKDWLKQRGIKVNEVAEKLGVGRHSVNHAFHQEQINESFKNRLLAAGYVVPNIHVKQEDLDVRPVALGLEMLAALKENNDTLKQLVATKDVIIKQLEFKIELIEKDNAILKQGFGSPKTKKLQH